MTEKRIVSATCGSLGAVHPVIALGLEFKARGHYVSIAVSVSEILTERQSVQFRSDPPILGP